MNQKAPLHAWALDPEEAARVQEELRSKLSLHWDGREVRTVAGVDIGLHEEMARCAMVVFSYPDLAHLEAVTADVPLIFPYIPGLLAFREGPAVLAAWEKLQKKPDLLMFDGQGIAHPRGVGIAAQMGLWLERATIGVAKSRLYGRHAEVGPRKGDLQPLYDPRRQGEVIGVALRSKEKTNLLYISPGDQMDVHYAVQFVLACLTQYRLPEPTRWAHKVAAGESFL